MGWLLHTGRTATSVLGNGFSPVLIDHGPGKRNPHPDLLMSKRRLPQLFNCKFSETACALKLVVLSGTDIIDAAVHLLCCVNYNCSCGVYNGNLSGVGLKVTLGSCFHTWAPRDCLS